MFSLVFGLPNWCEMQSVYISWTICEGEHGLGMSLGIFHIQPHIHVIVVLGQETCSTLHVSSSSPSFSLKGIQMGGHIGHAHPIVFSQLEKPYSSPSLSCRSMGGGGWALWASAHPSQTLDLPLPLSHTSLPSSLTWPPPLPRQAHLGVPLPPDGGKMCSRKNTINVI